VKVCIPSMGNKGFNEQVGEHYRSVPAYTLVDTDTNEVEVVMYTSENWDGSDNLSETIAKAGADTMICSNLSSKVIRQFEKLGIIVYVGANGTVKDALDMWKRGKLRKVTDDIACQLHAFRRNYNRHPL